MEEVILSFSNYTFKYNAQSKPTLYDINFEVHRGEKILIAGPSGCGKSTLIHSVNGLIPFSYKGESSGTLKLFGQETKKLSLFDISKHVGTVLQDSDAQFVGLTVAEDIAFALENDMIADPELHERVLDVSKLVEIDKHLSHSPGELSGGQKQRVSLAGVLVDDVDILLFDEPLANLDPKTGKQAIELIDEIQKKTGCAVIIVEHRLEDAIHRDVDRIVLLNEGRIVIDEKPDVLLSGAYLSDSGVREPLYITALKYAGVEITADMKPHSLGTLSVSDDIKRKVHDWYNDNCEKINKRFEGDILTCKDVSYTYPKGHRALENVSLSVKKGEMLAIVGTNGAGKSTFSKVVCGFCDNPAGTVSFYGKDMKSFSIKERAEHIGYVMQNPNQMISNVMIYDEIAYGLRCRNVAEDDIKTRVDETLKICGLWPFRNWPVSALSYGQKKRVTIASILVLKPEVIILDEPTAGQDYRHYTDILKFLETLNKSGITILMITHDMHLMLEYADRAVVFSKGRIVADDTPEKILTDSAIIDEASLKETSLYDLAKVCGIEDETDFVRRFIAYERRVRSND